MPEQWREYFDAMQVAPGAVGETTRDVAHAPVVQSFVQRAKAGALSGRAPGSIGADERLQVAALLLVAGYRIAGSRVITSYSIHYTKLYDRPI